MKKTKKITLVCIAVFLLLPLSGFCFERAMAMRAFRDYTAKQGVSSEIIEKKVFNEAKKGGIVIRVRYKDDPGVIYHYHYFFRIPRSHYIFRTWIADEEARWKVMWLEVSKDGYDLIFPYNECKYPPLVKTHGFG